MIIPILGMLTGIIIPVAVFIWQYKDAKGKRETVLEISKNLSDPSKIGPGLAVALVTTLYGSLLSNMYFIPMTSKLDFNTKAELQNIEIIKVGVDALLGGENPKIIRAKLGSFLGEKDEA